MDNRDKKIIQIVDTLMQVEDVSVLRGVQKELAKRLTTELAVVTHAHELNQEQRDGVIATIKERFDYEGEVQFTLDPSLGAGIRVQVGDYVFEDSARDTLLQLSSQMK